MRHRQITAAPVGRLEEIYGKRAPCVSFSPMCPLTDSRNTNTHDSLCCASEMDTDVGILLNKSIPNGGRQTSRRESSRSLQLSQKSILKVQLDWRHLLSGEFLKRAAWDAMGSPRSSATCLMRVRASYVEQQMLETAAWTQDERMSARAICCHNHNAAAVCDL